MFWDENIWEIKCENFSIRILPLMITDKLIFRHDTIRFRIYYYTNQRQNVYNSTNR
jgi:hypothetical protein